MPPLSLVTARRSIIAWLVLTAALAAAPLAAQQADSAHATPPAARCAYDACALRLEDDRLMQGAQGVEIGRLGIFTAPLHGVAWSSDSSRVQAARFSSRYASGRGFKTAAIFGSVVAGILLASVEESSASSRDYAGPVVLLVGSSVLSFVGQQMETSARRQLARAIWWHNRELRR